VLSQRVAKAFDFRRRSLISRSGNASPDFSARRAPPGWENGEVTKTPIDFKRDSGGSVNIGTDEDGAISRMVEIDGSLFIIKETAIYAARCGPD
jgi:hypothetical protein